MKILLVITSLGVGGAERLVTALASRFVAEGHEVVLVRFHGEAELLPSDPRVRLENLEMRRTPLGVLVAMRHLRRLIKAFSPDVVNSHLVHANILTRLLRLITPMPRLVSSAHNTNEEGRGRMLAYRLTDRLADISTNVSEEAVKAFELQGALKPSRMMAINNGIDINNFIFNIGAKEIIKSELYLSDSTKLLLAVGRLWEPKDYPNLLHAFAYIHTHNSSACLAIAGDGPLRSDLELLSAKLGISEKVIFLGVRHDITALLSACDIYVMSSAWEGLPMVILEAMAAQRCIVATDCGGIRVVLDDTGFVVETEDSQALGQALHRALSLSEEARGQMGMAARKRVVDHYSLQATAERYLTVYRDEELVSKE